MVLMNLFDINYTFVSVSNYNRIKLRVNRHLQRVTNQGLLLYHSIIAINYISGSFLDCSNFSFGTSTLAI